MKRIVIMLLLDVLVLVACRNYKVYDTDKKNIISITKSKYDQDYTEKWDLDFSGNSNRNNIYDGFWKTYKVYQNDYGISNYNMFNIMYNIKNNYWLVCSVFNGYRSFSNKYEWRLIFSAITEKDCIEGFETFEQGLTGIDNGLPDNYMCNFVSIMVLEDDEWLRSYIADEFEGDFVGYVVPTESIKVFPKSRNTNLNFKIFAKQNPDPTLDQYITVDPMEGLWYLSSDDSSASEEAFMNTDAILIIGKDEKRNPGWYHVVLYYDSGDKDKGWICEWGAAEINERELYVQLSSMSEGKPFSIVFKEQDGRRWLSIDHRLKDIKSGEFVRILPLK